MNRFSNLAEKFDNPEELSARPTQSSPATAPSRIGRKAISGYFSPELSMALHHCARKNGLTLQELMAEAFNDALRKYDESPVGN